MIDRQVPVVVVIVVVVVVVGVMNNYVLGEE